MLDGKQWAIQGSKGSIRLDGTRCQDQISPFSTNGD